MVCPRRHRRKRESLEATVERVAREELGAGIDIERQLGVYEHLYQVADISEADGKLYVAIAFVVALTSDDARPDIQHDDRRTFIPPFDDFDLHPPVVTYLEDAEFIESKRR